MKANATPIDRAFERCRLLAGLIASEHKRARAYPTDDRYVELGLIERGAKIEKEKIRQAIDQKFDDLSALVEHVVILDMVAALELHFDGRIKTAVGEARRTLKGKFGDSALAGRNKLVRETDDFRGLQNIIDLVEPDISIEMQAILKNIRDNRNKFAHGTNVRNPPTILKEDAKAALNELHDLLNPL